MTSNHDLLFIDGSIHLLVRWACVDAGESLEDELERFCRVVRDSPVAWSTMPLGVVSALLDVLADEIDSAGSPPRPAEFDVLPARAAGDWPPAEFLRYPAEYLRDKDYEPSPRLEELPMSRPESWIRFSQAFQILHRFVRISSSDPYPDVEAAAGAAASTEHPIACDTVMASAAAELQQILLMFRSREELDTLLRDFAWPPPSRQDLQSLPAAIHTHFDEQH
ncbi:hypothetical protein [Embleya sp. NPDC050493]|uniref:hypothetical protein n=1 Tax=Embleya sp. NPDC050493 TaxID=3363989 RepID=UPI00379ACC99